MKHIVYRYIDKTDGIIKYVGITREGRINQRMAVHEVQDKWKYDGVWRIEYFECENKSEAEAYESHLITLYDTGKYYNKSKVGWGLNQYLPSVEDKWQVLYDCPFDDVITVKASKLFKWLLKKGYKKEALSILDCFEFKE